MYIKKEYDFLKKLKILINKIKPVIRRKRYIYNIGISLSCILVIFYLGYMTSKKGIIDIYIRPFLNIKKKFFINYINSFKQRNVEKVFINISYKNFQKLSYQRHLALQGGHILNKGNKKYVNAELVYNNEKIPAKIRLKGDWLDHVRGKKWSYRVVVKGEKSLLGMKRFSLQHPKTRNYLYEWLYHKIMRKNGLMSLRYKFVKIIINGENFGIYALEEHFRKELIEFNNRREGVILKFDETNLWENRHKYKFMNTNDSINGGGFIDALITCFDNKKIQADQTLMDQFLRGQELLEAFRRETKPVEEIFDIEKLALFYAVSDLLGATHSYTWHNRRFYYNPMSDKIEPISFDGMLCGEQGLMVALANNYRYKKNRDLSLINDYVFIEKDIEYILFKSNLFFKEYMMALEKVSVKSYLDAIFYELKDEIDKNLNILYKEFPKYFFNKDCIYRNQKFIKERLNAENALDIHIYDVSDNKVKLQIGNKHNLPIEILAVEIKNNKNKILDNNICEGRKIASPIFFNIYNISLPLKMSILKKEIKTLKVYYRLLGGNTIYTSEAKDWPLLIEDTKKDEIKSILDVSHEMFEIDRAKKSINIKQGNWEIKEPLFIPSDYTVNCYKGTKINLINKSFIYSLSAFTFYGTEKEKITIFSSDLKGQGLYINSKQESIFYHVIFKDLSALSLDKWTLTGAVCVYRSKVRFVNCDFLNINAEDGLNIVDSYFHIEKTAFKECKSDALDIDFSRGNIMGCQFYSSGNDSLDFSGSNVILDNITIFKAKDKGISAGERSSLQINKISIFNSTIGIASKDSSHIEGANVFIKNCNIGLIVYQKKSEFSEASISLNKTFIEETQNDYLVEKKSELILNTKKIKGNQENLYRGYIKNAN